MMQFSPVISLNSCRIVFLTSGVKLISVDMTYIFLTSYLGTPEARMFTWSRMNNGFARVKDVYNVPDIAKTASYIRASGVSGCDT